jgi:hypothetical protein
MQKAGFFTKLIFSYFAVLLFKVSAWGSNLAYLMVFFFLFLQVTPNGVRFTGHEHITQVDTIVWATGYCKNFPFLSQVGSYSLNFERTFIEEEM